MLTRAAVGWLVILFLAVLNGALRQGLLIPRIGERAGHIVSTFLLSAIILGAAWLLLPWIRAASARDAWIIGALWVVLTIAFEFLGGHYLFGDSWEQLLAEYNVAQGRIWILILITALLAPVLVWTWRPPAPFS
jgi:hypothetical protein